jgi:hypothetical protein
VLDDIDRPALTDQLDPSGSYRRALRAALLKALEERALRCACGCGRASLRPPHCVTHGDGRTNR